MDVKKEQIRKECIYRKVFSWRMHYGSSVKQSSMKLGITNVRCFANFYVHRLESLNFASGLNNPITFSHRKAMNTTTALTITQSER